jgi:hypothetical protein
MIWESVWFSISVYLYSLNVWILCDKVFKQVAYSYTLGICEATSGITKDVDGCCIVRKIPLSHRFVVSVSFYCAVALNDVVVACIELTEAAGGTDKVFFSSTIERLFYNVEPIGAGTFFEL